MNRANRHARAHGFTLIELLVAIAILALVAVLSWRGLDQILRARETVAAAMEKERALVQFFDQFGLDARAAAADDVIGAPAEPVSVEAGWSAVTLMRDTLAFNVRIWMPKLGWGDQMSATQRPASPT